MLVINGGFETGDFSGWSNDFTTGDTFVSSWPAFFLPDYGAHSGNYVAFFGAYGSTDQDIFQTLATTPGKTYTLDFWLANYDDHPGDLDSHFAAYWNGTQVLNSLNVGGPFDWTEYTYTLKATSSSTTIEFGGYEPPGAYALDDVSVVANGAVVVPEPATISTIARCLPLGLVFWRWRRRRARRIAP